MSWRSVVSNALLVFGLRVRAGSNDHEPFVAINDHEVIGDDVLRDALDPRYGRNTERAREQGAVRRRSPELAREPQCPAGLQLYDERRSRTIADDDASVDAPLTFDPEHVSEDTAP